jgi:hypothetical protein
MIGVKPLRSQKGFQLFSSLPFQICSFFCREIAIAVFIKPG